MYCLYLVREMEWNRFIKSIPGPFHPHPIRHLVTLITSTPPPWQPMMVLPSLTHHWSSNLNVSIDTPRKNNNLTIFLQSTGNICQNGNLKDCFNVIPQNLLAYSYWLYERNIFYHPYSINHQHVMIASLPISVIVWNYGLLKYESQHICFSLLYKSTMNKNNGI